MSDVLRQVVSTLKEARAIRQEDEQVAQSLAATHCRLKDYERASSVFRDILRFSPDNTLAQQGLKACEEELLRSTAPAAKPGPAAGPVYKKPEPTVAPKKTEPAVASSPAPAAGPSSGGDLLGEIRASGSYHSHDSLKTAPFPAGVDQSKRELYLR